MRHGERMAYPVFVMQNESNVGLWLYDIGCQLHRALQKETFSVPFNGSIGVPAFHIYGHIMSCQLQYSPRRIEGAGLFDGEGTERMWSYLGKFSRITKEQTPENRQDLLSEALLNLGTKQEQKQGHSLGERYQKAFMMKETCEKTLQDDLKLLPGTTVSDVQQWALEEVLSSQERRGKSFGEFWQHEYALHLNKYYQISQLLDSKNVEDDLEQELESEELSRLNTVLLRTERKQKINRWSATSPLYIKHLKTACDDRKLKRLAELRDLVVQYNFMVNMKKKYARGQSLANRINKQVQATSRKVNKALTAYNDVPHHGSGTQQLERSTIMDLQNEIWKSLTPQMMKNPATDVPTVPSVVKRKLVDCLLLKNRAMEELSFTVTDLSRYVSNLSKVCLVIQDKINHAVLDSYFQRGAVALLTKHHEEIKSRLETAQSIWERINRNSSGDTVVTMIEDVLSIPVKEPPYPVEGSFAESEIGYFSDEDLE